MSTIQLQETIESLLKTKFGTDAGEDGSTVLDDLGIDSLAIVELLLEIQKATGVKVETGEILPTHTVAEAAAIVAAKETR